MNPMKLKLFLSILLFALASFGLSGCGGDSKDPSLQKASAYVRYLTNRRFLSLSAFEHTFPEKKPSQFVGYLFSDIGAPEWAGVVDDGSMEAKQMKSARIPLPPPNVIITNRLLPKQKSRQILLKADDDAGIVIVEAYLDPAGPPQFVEQFPLQ